MLARFLHPFIVLVPLLFARIALQRRATGFVPGEELWKGMRPLHFSIANAATADKTIESHGGTYSNFRSPFSYAAFNSRMRSSVVCAIQKPHTMGLTLPPWFSCRAAS